MATNEIDVGLSSFRRADDLAAMRRIQLMHLSVMSCLLGSSE